VIAFKKYNYNRNTVASSR